MMLLPLLVLAGGLAAIRRGWVVSGAGVLRGFAALRTALMVPQLAVPGRFVFVLLLRRAHDPTAHTLWPLTCALMVASLAVHVGPIEMLGR